MRQRSIQWLMLVSAVSGLVWLGGLAWALYGHFGGTPTEAAPAAEQPNKPVAASASPASASTPAAEKEDGSFRILALGDSLTRGFGDPEGKGYAGQLADMLKTKTNRNIVLDNLGVNGQTSVQLAASLQQEDVQSKAKAANLLLVSIGGNDLFRGGQTLLNLDLAKIGDMEDEFNKQLKSILSTLRELNPRAELMLIGLYNPFIELKDSAVTSKVVRDWNYQVGETASLYPKTVIVPTYDLFQLNVQNYLYVDQFHPNTKGYRLIADRLSSLVTVQEANG